MKTTMTMAGLAAVMAVGTAASAQLRMQFDVNGMTFQARDTSGAATAFGGLTHTGAVSLGFSPTAPTVLNGVALRVGGGPSTPQTVGFGLTSFVGTINLTNGLVTGGNIFLQIANGDTYRTDIRVGAGTVTPFVGGGFKIEGLTFNGKFSDSQFGLIDVSPFFSAQTRPGQLLGDFIQFNFEPDARGGGFADMDLFVVVPLPPAGWAGLGTLAGVMAIGYVRRRRQA